MTRSKLPQERIVAVYINQEEVARLHCSPYNIDELAIGFLLNDGYVRNYGDIQSVDTDEKGLAVYIKAPYARDADGKVTYRASGCGAASRLFSDETIKKRAHPKINPEKLELTVKMKDMLKQTKLYSETGGLHCSALVDDKGLIVVREDIGRHNTFDKLVGHATLKGLDPSKLTVLTTGRISYEMMYKIVLAGFPAVASLTAATDLAADLANEFGITAIGYVRGDNYTVYSSPEYVKAGV